MSRIHNTLNKTYCDVGKILVLEAVLQVGAQLLVTPVPEEKMRAYYKGMCHEIP
jgi:hypothetical protein